MDRDCYCLRKKIDKFDRHHCAIDVLIVLCLCVLQCFGKGTHSVSKEKLISAFLCIDRLIRI
ncbi:hypothetical protein BLOT_010406 [Blomia tropicalis]|nr:hypothetical protein BLOT_010406 [Blomia tropicalis]